MVEAQNTRRASYAAGTGVAGLGAVVVYLAGLAGIDVSPEVAAAVGGAVSVAAAGVVHYGIRGLLRIIWNGDGA